MKQDLDCQIACATSLEARNQSLIQFTAVTLDLGGKTIVENFGIKVGRGEFVCVIGASGRGKSTALRLAAGLYQTTSGTVSFGGAPMNQPRRDIAILCRITATR